MLRTTDLLPLPFSPTAMGLVLLTALALGCGSASHDANGDDGSGGDLSSSTHATRSSASNTTSSGGTSATSSAGASESTATTGTSTVGGVGGASGSGGSNVGGGGTGATGNSADVCATPVPWTDEADVGVFECRGGIVWRKEAVECPRGITRSDPVDLPSNVDPSLVTRDDCAHDDDCGELEVCQLGINYEDPCMGGDPDAVISAYRVCEAHCQSDADCGYNMLCLCDETGDGLNRCVSTLPPDVEGACWGDSDCGEGLRCLGTPWGPFVCEHPLDECQASEDCEAGELCNPTFDPENEGYVRKCFEDVGACALG